MRFLIVTPVFNGARFIDETILSVVTQAGSFSVRYHVQDAGSTDGTLEKLERWKARLGSDFPHFCSGVSFSYASQHDAGLYDGVNRGFATCGTGDLMSWINADDRYQPGAFAAVAQILGQLGDIDWITGRMLLIDGHGAPIVHLEAQSYPREAIAAGVFDGRAPRHATIQQEGTFWRARLWDKVNGADARFRLAGDFDLWRRFAVHADLVVADAFLGCWRHREGQLTQSRAPYQAEIDRLARPNGAERARVAELMARGRLGHRSVARRAAGAWTCRYHAPRTFMSDLWALRRFLPAALSIRSVKRRRSERISATK